MKVDLGCGTEGNKRDGCVGVDFVEGDGVDIACDFETEGLPFADGEVEQVFSSHCLEHLSDARVPFVLAEVRRVLVPGGKFELLVPDLVWVLEAFLRCPEGSRWGFPLMTIYGAQNRHGEYHKTGFSLERLKRLVLESGLHVDACLHVWSHSQRCVLLRGHR